MRLAIGGRVLEFTPAELQFHQRNLTNVFAEKNNKTVLETLEHIRYQPLCAPVKREYPDSLNQCLGEFLHCLKLRRDLFYKNFLNLYGDLTYCRFSICDAAHSRGRGLYCFVARDTEEIKYIGKTTDSFKKRINQGYGQIHPKNCYLDGQATNCHLNALIADSKESVGLRVCPLEDAPEIARLEKLLIRTFRPEWNIALG